MNLMDWGATGEAVKRPILRTIATRAHVIQNARQAGLMLEGADEYGPSWMGSREKHELFAKLEYDWDI